MKKQREILKNVLLKNQKARKYVTCVEAPLDRSKAQVGWGHNGVGGGVGWGKYLHTRNIQRKIFQSFLFSKTNTGEKLQLVWKHLQVLQFHGRSYPDLMGKDGARIGWGWGSVFTKYIGLFIYKKSNGIICDLTYMQTSSLFSRLWLLDNFWASQWVQALMHMQVYIFI